MNTINGIPLIWDEEGDNQMLGGVFQNAHTFPETPAFPEQNNSSPFNYKSPFSNGLFFNTALFEEDNEGNSDKNTYVIFREFETYEYLNKYFKGTGTDGAGKTITQTMSAYASCMVLCYISFGNAKDNELAARMTPGLADGLSRLSIGDLNETLNAYAGKITEFAKARHGFTFRQPEIKDVLLEAVPVHFDKLRPVQRITPGKKKLYEDNYRHFMQVTEHAEDPETHQAIRRLCNLLARMDYDVLDTYNQQIGLHTNHETISLTAILSMIQRLRQTARAVEHLQTNWFNHSGEVIDFINEYFTDPSAIGAETKFIINYPFIKMPYENRIKMLRQFLRGDTLEFSGFWAGANFEGHHYISGGDIVYNLLITAGMKERLKLVKELDETGDLFYLLNDSAGDCFTTISFIVGGTALSAVDTHEKQTEALIEAMSNQNYFFYAAHDNGKIQEYDYDGEKRLIKLENKGHNYESTNPPVQYRNTGTEMEKKRRQIKKHEEDFARRQEAYLNAYASKKIYFNPLEMIVFTAESDLNSGVIKALFKDDKYIMKQDDMLLLPACLVYLIFKDYGEREAAFRTLALFALAFLPLGVGALVGALEAASAWGITVALTDISLDIGLLAANDPKNAENNPEQAKIINTLGFFYGLARVTPLLGSIPKIPGAINKFFEQAVKITQGNFRKMWDELKYLLKYESKGEALFRDIFKLINKGELTAYQFGRIAKKLKTETGIDLHLIDAAAKEFKDLHRAWREEPVYAMFHSHKFRNTRYGIVLDGPAIYFFRGGDYKLTAYTMQHELFHVKLWYNLVKQYGKKGGLAMYNRIPTWLHEADVIGGFLKQNKRKPGKWPLEEIENDLNTLNYNIKNFSRWRDPFKKMTGKELLTLKDLENWDITKWIK